MHKTPLILLRHMALSLALICAGLWGFAPSAQAQQRIILQDSADYEYARHIHSRTRVQLARNGDWIVKTWFRNGNREIKGVIRVETRVLSAEGRCLFATNQTVEIERTSNAFSIDQSLEKTGKIPRRLARFADRAEFRTQLFPAGLNGRVDGVPPQNIALKTDMCDLGTTGRPAPQPAPPNITLNKGNAAQVPALTYLVLP